MAVSYLETKTSISLNRTYHTVDEFSLKRTYHIVDEFLSLQQLIFHLTTFQP